MKRKYDTHEILQIYEYQNGATDLFWLLSHKKRLHWG
jgi:hypothetical protein